MLVPPLNPVKTDINVVRRFYQFVGKTWPTARAEYGASFSERSENLLVPPTAVTEFHHVPPDGIELGENSIKAGRRVMKAGRKLKEEAAHSRARAGRRYDRNPNQRLRSREAFDVRDQVRRP